jgi:hypothetical protein
MELDLATVEDIAAELKRRRVEFALYVGCDRPPPTQALDDVQAPKVFAGVNGGDRPACRAEIMCNGLWWCIGEAIGPKSNATLAANLSRQLSELRDTLEQSRRQGDG